MLTTYTYDKSNRLQTANAGGSITTYMNDLAGNRLSQVSSGSGAESLYFTWDAPGRMATVEVGSGTVTLTYNAEGQRVAKEGPDGATGYLYDYERLLHETDDVGEIVNTYASGTSEEFGDLIGEDGGLVHQYDAQADTAALLDNTGTVEAQYKYTAFGEVSAVSVAGGPWSDEDWSSLPLELTSHMMAGGKKHYYLDTETALYLLGAGVNGRYYDASTGRFLSEDPTRHQGGDLNLYAYVHNDPINKADPSGHGLNPLSWHWVQQTEHAAVVATHAIGHDAVVATHAVGHASAVVWDTIRPHPVDGYNAARAQADIMFDPTQPALNRVGGGFGTLGNTILTVTDLVPGVGKLEKKLGLSIGKRAIEAGLESGAKNLAKDLAEKEGENIVKSVVETGTKDATKKGTEETGESAAKTTAENTEKNAAEKTGNEAAKEAESNAKAGKKKVDLKTKTDGELAEMRRTGQIDDKDLRKAGYSNEDIKAINEQAKNNAAEMDRTRYDRQKVIDDTTGSKNDAKQTAKDLGNNPNSEDARDAAARAAQQEKEIDRKSKQLARERRRLYKNPDPPQNKDED